MKKLLLPFIGIFLLIALYFWSTYNSLVKLDVEVEAQWGQVENVYQRRLDLIPNLVNTVKGYASHEKEILESIAEARTRYAGASNSEEKVAAANELESALGRLLVIVENYPDLKANQTFSDLMTELEGTENRIAVERRNYNEVVKNYNQKVRVFPTNLVAGLLGFEQVEFFEAAQGAEEPPEVEF